MPDKRCPSCGRLHDVEVITCDCGASLATTAPNRHSLQKIPRPYQRDSQLLRQISLNLAAILSAFSAIAALLAAVYFLYHSDWLSGLILCPLSGLYSLAMYHVFRDVADH